MEQLRRACRLPSKRTNSARDFCKSLAASLGPAILDRDGAALDPTEFAQPLHKSGGPLGTRACSCPKTASPPPVVPRDTRAVLQGTELAMVSQGVTERFYNLLAVGLSSRCLKWINRVGFAMSALRPLIPRKRRNSGHRWMSQTYQDRTSGLHPLSCTIT
jgi:hypothetical protein